MANAGQLYRRQSSTLESDEAAVEDDVIREYGNPELAETRLVSRPESSDVARRLATGVLKLWQLNACTEDAQQLVGELVANAVRHTTARAFGFRMLRRQGWIRIEVRDPSRALPCLLPPQPQDESGWGLFLVDRISDRWGVDLLPRGKTVWAELRVSED
ncbi:ATP-binding protein [Streptomyces sp. NPDC019890]|uniref:ATP-binding protein n=1 Tax=Streptomyces sp. NPDC019890 TaxID=3365064 RepID=UPI00384B55E0